MADLQALALALSRSMQAFVTAMEAGDSARVRIETKKLIGQVEQALDFEQVSEDLLELVVYAVGILPEEMVADGVIDLLRRKIAKPTGASRISAMRVAAYGLQPHLALGVLETAAAGQKGVSFTRDREAEERDFLLTQVLPRRFAAVRRQAEQQQSS